MNMVQSTFFLSSGQGRAKWHFHFLCNNKFILVFWLHPSSFCLYLGREVPVNKYDYQIKRLTNDLAAVFEATSTFRLLW
jgi:hypothetical protein